MIALDTNVLVYAHRAESAFHTAAYACLHEFLAVVTHPKIFSPASSHAQALAQVDA